MSKKIAFVGFQTDSNSQIPSGPWKILYEKLESKGFILAPEISDADYYVFLNNDLRDYRRFVKNSKDSVVILMEPPSTRTENFSKELVQQFSKIYSPSPYWHEHTSVIAFDWPIAKPFDIPLNFHSRKPKAVSVHSNKFSLAPGQLYDLRRELLRNRATHLDTFGMGWEWGINSKFRSVITAIRNVSSVHEINLQKIARYLLFPANYSSIQIPDKIELMCKYQFSLVIENDSSYVSEKIWDALNAETIPLYVGANLSKFGLTNGLVYECEPTFEAIVSKLYELVSRDQFERYLEIREFKKSDMWQQRVNSVVIEGLARSIANTFGH